MPRKPKPGPATPNAGNSISSIKYPARRKKPWFEVEPVALHMHERISTQAILRVLAREDVERDSFPN